SGHGLQHPESRTDVLPVVRNATAHRRTHVEKRREVKDGRYVISADRARHGGYIRDVAFHDVAVSYGFAMPRHQVVEHHHFVTGPVQGFRGVASDVASASCHEHAALVSGQWRNT